jgi:hypothetical protein
VCPSSFIDRRRVYQIPHTLHELKALKYGHCRGRTSSIGADRGDNRIWIYGLADSFVTFNNVEIAPGWIIVFNNKIEMCATSSLWQI